MEIKKQKSDKGAKAPESRITPGEQKPIMGIDSSRSRLSLKNGRPALSTKASKLRKLIEEKGVMNPRGQVIIPKNIREYLGKHLDIGHNIDIKIRLMPNLTIELSPTQTFEMSTYMEDHPELLKSAANAFVDSKTGNLMTEAQIEEMLRE